MGPLEHGLTQLKDEHWRNARSIVSPTFSAAKLKAVKASLVVSTCRAVGCPLQMYGLMDQISDRFDDLLCDYADKGEILNIKEWVDELAPHLCEMWRRQTEKYTLDTIASCLFGIETNSLENENITLVKHLKKLFTLSFTNLLVIVFSKRRDGHFSTWFNLYHCHSSDFTETCGLFGSERFFSDAEIDDGLFDRTDQSDSRSSSKTSRAPERFHTGHGRSRRNGARRRTIWTGDRWFEEK